LALARSLQLPESTYCSQNLASVYETLNVEFPAEFYVIY